MTSNSASMGEQPIFSTKAHVFHIDPKTKRSWIPASSQAVNVSFFFDATRNLYRIISVEGTKAVINSTVTPSMTFTKTSQKFGQWSDIRANTVYGLGFNSEVDLNKFVEKFQEVKEATRNSAAATPQQSSGGNPATKTTLNGGPIATGTSSSPNSTLQRPGGDVNEVAKESPKHPGGGGKAGGAQMPQSTVEAQLRYENDRLKLALAQSSANAKKWEVELQSLKTSNARLTCALQESTANVEEWKRQLQMLKEENTRMRSRLVELEAANGNPDAIAELRQELQSLRQRSESAEHETKQREKEAEALRRRLDEISGGGGAAINSKVEDRLKMLLAENDSLRTTVSRLQEQLESVRLTGSKQQALEQVNQRLLLKVEELRDIQNDLSSLIGTSSSSSSS